DPAFTVLDGLAAQARYARERTGGDRVLQISKRRDAVIREEHGRGLGSDAGYAQHLQQRRRKTLVKGRELFGRAGLHELLDRGADRFSDAGKLEVLARGNEIGQRRGVLDRRPPPFARPIFLKR